MIAPPWLSIPPQGYGGIENVLEALVPALLDLGIEVELFTTGDSTIPTTKMHWLYKKGQYEHIHNPQYDSLPISIAHLLFALNRIREDGGFDIIHDHNGFVGPLALSHASRDLPPTIHTLHGPPFTTPDRLKIGLPDNQPMWRQFATDRVYFVGISDALMKTAPAELQPHILPSVHNAINAQQFPFVSKKEDYFITLARFSPDKGQDVAIRACMDLECNLKLAGRVGDLSTPRRVMMELANPLSAYRGLTDFRYYSDKVFPHLLNDHIQYVGEVSGQRKLEFIGRSKGLLFPIQWDEPFGMAPIEALACGTPVIAMNRGAMPEIIEHGVNGFLAKDEDEFKHYMTRIGEIDPRECRRSVEQRFSAREMAKRYVERYQLVLDRRMAPRE
jgi:glycosyltransferase involved in cell wall biosynthesis